MGRMTILQRVREWIAGIAFGVFCWAIGMTEDEYLTAITQEGIRGFIEAQQEEYTNALIKIGTRDKYARKKNTR